MSPNQQQTDSTASTHDSPVNIERALRETDDAQRCVSFALNGERFALRVSQIREVLPMPALTPVPDSPPACLGLINLRGRIVTVLDLHQLLQIDAPQDSANAHLLVADLEGELMALVVDGIGEVTLLRAEKIETGHAAHGQLHGYGVAHVAGGFIVMLNLESLLEASGAF